MVAAMKHPRKAIARLGLVTAGACLLVTPVPALLARPGVGSGGPAAPGTLPVVFVPGIGGSLLVDAAGAEYWPAAGYPSHDKLTLYPSQPHPSLHASDAFTQATFLGIHVPSQDKETYGPLLAYLGANGFVQYRTGGDPARRTTAGCDVAQAPARPNLFVFPYDWRLGNAVSAAALADYVGCVRRIYPGTQVNLVTHSMGGLVARRYLLDHPTDHHVNALITFAAPWLGAGKLGWVMETGQFVFFVWSSTLLDAVGSFTGAHELMTSRAWYALGGAPALVEAGQDLNKNGIDTESYGYDQLVAYMDAFKGREGFLPGTANRTFHDFTSPAGGQDDWRSDRTGVKFFHVAGQGGGPDTVVQVMATTLLKCAAHYSTCDFKTWEYPVLGGGDQTVPVLSATRQGAGTDYNAAGATLYTCLSTEVNSPHVSHTAMLSNPVLQGLLLQYLAQANGAPAQPPPDPAACGAGVVSPPATAPEPYHQLEIDGGVDLAIQSAAFPPDAQPRFLPGVGRYDMGPAASRLVMDTGEYTVTFKTTGGPLYLEWTYGDAASASDAVRYLDVPLPADRSAALHVLDGELDTLRYDADGNGSWETIAPATVTLQGPAAADELAPRFTITGELLYEGTRVSVEAVDPSGIDVLAYTLDGRHFLGYAGPFLVPRGRETTVQVFAQDFAGNRSSPRSYRIPAGRLLLPLVLGPRARP
jgi:pimeloyl-ACP methyl ester carboxylesterase